MTILLTILAILAVAGVGFGSLVTRKRSLLQRLDFTREYHEQCGKLATAYVNGNVDHDAYNWCNARIVKMQNELGRLGSYMVKPPGSLTYYPGYEILPFILPRIRTNDVKREELLHIDDALVRRMGVLTEEVNELTYQLLNPLIWLREGVQWFLLLPASILKWFGVLPAARFDRIASWGLVKALGFIVTLIGLVSSIMGIVLGWEDFGEWIRGLF